MKPPRTTAQMQRIKCVRGKPIVYDPPELVAAKEKLKAHLGKHAPKEPYDTALRVVVKWCFPKGKYHKNGEWKSTRPDGHNLSKALFDVMTELGFWTDDAIVASDTVEKFWADVPGLWILIEELR